MSASQYDVIVIGGGLAGNTLACLLAAGGLECLVIEAGSPSSAADNDPRALAITHASRHILEAAGAWQHVAAEHLGHFRGMHVWDENGAGEVSFDSAELCLPTLGYIIQQPRLQQCLEQAAADMPGVTTRFDSGLMDIRWQDDGICALLENGESLSACLMVGADGARSRSRDLAGIHCPGKDYHQQAVACLVSTALAHEDVARQRFLSDGPLAFLPMASANQCGIVWSTRPDHAEQLMQMDEAAFNGQLQEAFSHTLGEILHSEQRLSFPLRRAQAEHYCLERFALIGDAAHSVHPLAGQGANLGLLDAASLAELVLTAHARKRNIAGRRVLRGYERWRRGENRMMMIVFEGFKHAFENQAAPLPRLRNRALDLANSIVPLKHTIMRHAMGLAGDLPAVARKNFAL